MTPLLFDGAHHEPAVLAALHGASFAEAWNARAICDLLAGPGVFVFFTPDAFVMARAAAGEAEILTLAVMPAARRLGLGRILVQTAAVHAGGLGAAALFLEVGTDNAPALGLYAGLGFVQVGQRPGYYDGKDALVLKADLPLSLASVFA